MYTLVVVVVVYLQFVYCFYRLLNASLSWFRPFKVIVDGDIEDFAVAEETADPSPMVKRFRVSITE